MKYRRIGFMDKYALENYEEMFSYDKEQMNTKGIHRLQNLKTFTLTFDKGFQMDIKINSSEDDIWSEAVLFDGEGHQLAFTEPSDTIKGEWEIEYNGDTYTGEIRPYVNGMGF